VRVLGGGGGEGGGVEGGGVGVGGTDVQVLQLFAARNVCPLGPARRFLFLPEETARIAPSKVIAVS
jgi:hypothetical protein